MKTVIEMAREAGIVGNFWPELERFAELVRANERDRAMRENAYVAYEREQCAQIAESKRHAPNFQLTSMPPQNGTAVDIANAIRARSNT